MRPVATRALIRIMGALLESFAMSAVGRPMCRDNGQGGVRVPPAFRCLNGQRALCSKHTWRSLADLGRPRYRASLSVVMESPVRRLLSVVGALLVAGSSAWGQPQQKGSSQTDNISACSLLAYEPAANAKRKDLFAKCSKAPRADCESVRDIFKQDGVRDAGLVCTGSQ